MMRLSWAELLNELSVKLQQNDYQNITPLLENVQVLNSAYATKPLYFDRIDSCVKDMSDLLVEKSASNEQITKKMQELCDCMHEVVDSKIKPLMFMQVWYMERMKILNYNINFYGECYGVSNMAIQAFFANDMDTFNKRLQIIYDTPLEDFKNDFANLRAQKQQFMEKGQEVEAKKMNEKIIDLYAFFDGVALTQKPMIYLHDQENQPISKKQDARKTRPITIPVTLEDSKNSPSTIASNFGIYSKQHLLDYLDLLKRDLGDHSFALNLIAMSHAITVTWDFNTKRWLLLDPNNLPGEEYIHLDQLSNALFGNFTQGRPMGMLPMGTQILAATQHEEVMQRQFEHLKTTPEWSASHNPSVKVLETTRMIYMSQEELYDLYYNNPDSLKWDDNQILDHALENQLNDFITKFISEKGTTPFLNIDNKKLSALIPILPRKYQEKLLEELTADQKIKIISDSAFKYDIFQMLPEQERISIFLGFSPSSQGRCLNELSTSGLIEQHNKLLQHLTVEEKAKVIGLEHNPSNLLQMLTDEERLSVFLKLTPIVHKNYLAHLSYVGMIEYRNNLFKNMTEEQKTNIIVVLFGLFTLSKLSEEERQEIKTYLQMLDENEYLILFQKLKIFKQAEYMSILSSGSLINQRDNLLQKLSTEQKTTILENYKYMSDEDAECLTAIMKSLPESSYLKAVIKQDADGITILHRAADNPACLNVLLNSLPVSQRLEAVKIKTNNNNNVLLLSKNPDCLDMLLKVYPKDERLEALTEYPYGAYQSVLYTAFCNDELLKTVMDNLPHSEQPEDSPEKLRSVHKVLSVLVELPPLHPECVSAMLSILPEKQLMEAICEKKTYAPPILNHAIEKPAFLSVFLNRLSGSKRWEILNEPIDKDGNNALYCAADKPDSMKAILSALNIDERFEVLKSLQNDEFGFQLPDLFPEMKKIMLDKIAKTDSELNFEPVKQRVIDATTFSELKEQLQELDYLYLKAKQNDIKLNINLARPDVENDYKENQVPRQRP